MCFIILLFLVFCKSAIFHDSLYTSFLCIENVLRIKREALLREGSWRVTKKDEVMPCFARISA